MSRVTPERQRELLEGFKTPGFLSTPDGALFIDEVSRNIAPGLYKAAREMESAYRLDFNEIVNIVVVNVATSSPKRLDYFIDARSPWGYLCKTAVTWLPAEWGHRGVLIEDPSLFETDSNVAEPDRDAPTTEDEIRIAEITSLACAILLPRTPERLRDDVARLVNWLAWHPVQRLTYEAHDRALAALSFPTLTCDQIRAVMNMVVGGRPVRAATSLFAAVALDAGFVPTQNPTIARALSNYRRIMTESVLTRELEEAKH